MSLTLLQNSTKSSRDGFADALAELAGNQNVWVVSADLEKSLGLTKFKELAPKRFVECGIAEQSAATVAAGIAMADPNNIVYFASFAEFLPMRCVDQIRISIDQQNLNVKLISSHVGLSYAADGMSVQVLEDLGVMQSFVNMQIFSPADYTEAKNLTLLSANELGPTYIRLNREPEIAIEVNPRAQKYNLEYPERLVFESHQTNENHKKKILLIAHGTMVGESMNLAKLIDEKFGYPVSIYNSSRIKPLLDKDIATLVSNFDEVYVLEEHNRVGGLGTTIAGFLAEKSLLQGKIFRIIALDRYGESARTTAQLRKHLKFTATEIFDRYFCSNSSR